jgi:hypothetical protein
VPGHLVPGVPGVELGQDRGGDSLQHLLGEDPGQSSVVQWALGICQVMSGEIVGT